MAESELLNRKKKVSEGKMKPGYWYSGQYGEQSPEENAATNQREYEVDNQKKIRNESEKIGSKSPVDIFAKDHGAKIEAIRDKVLANRNR
jgi:hypothetical protein